MSMNIRNTAARIPRSTAIHSTFRMPVGRRGVGGTSMPKHDKKGLNLPVIAGSAVVTVTAVTYAVGRSSWNHGENIAAEAKEVPQANKVGHPSQPGPPAEAEFGRDDVHDSIIRSMRADAPKSAYKAEKEDTAKGLANEISPQELSGAIKQSLRADAPKTAYQAEEDGITAGTKGGGGYQTLSSRGEGSSSTNQSLKTDVPKPTAKAGGERG